MCHAQYKDGNIAELLGELELHFTSDRAIVIAVPLNQFCQLSNFGDDPQHKIAGSMQTPPVPLLGKIGKKSLQILDAGRGAVQF
jgi:hypothetical protein